MKLAAYGQRKSFRNNYLALAIITLLFSYSANAQYFPRANNYGSGDQRRYIDSTLFYPTGCGTPSLQGVDLHRSALFFDSCNHRLWVYDPKRAAWDSAKNAATDSSIYLTVTGGNNRYVQIQTYPPLASLTGGGNFELHSAGTFSQTLNWGATRQAATTGVFATANLSTIVVAGVTQTFSNPSAGGTVSGTQNVTVTWNSNNSYNNVVTTIDGKTATASTANNFYSTYYIGYVSSSSPSDANLIAGFNFLNTANSRVTSGTLSTPGGSSYIVFAFPASYGAATVTINGLGVGYNLTTRSVINASGYSQSYNIYVSPFATSSGVTYSIN